MYVKIFNNYSDLANLELNLSNLYVHCTMYIHITYCPTMLSVIHFVGEKGSSIYFAIFLENMYFSSYEKGNDLEG